MALLTLTNPTKFTNVPCFPLNGFAIVPSDVDTFSSPVTAYAGTAGTISVRPWASPGTGVTYTVPAGYPVPCQVAGVNSTGTTSTGIAGSY